PRRGMSRAATTTSLFEPVKLGPLPRPKTRTPPKARSASTRPTITKSLPLPVRGRGAAETAKETHLRALAAKMRANYMDAVANGNPLKKLQEKTNASTRDSLLQMAVFT